jgi:hypothetical protein
VFNGRPTPYRDPPETSASLTLEELTSQLGESLLTAKKSTQALALIVAREQLGEDASEAQVEELARETADLLEGSPLLESLLRR